MPSAVSYAANDRISTPGFSGWAHRVEPAAAQRLGRRQMRPIGDGLVLAHTRYLAVLHALFAAGQTRTTLNDARSANLKARTLYSGKAKSNSHLSRAQFVPNMPCNCGHSRQIMVSLFLCM
jgi:hypothetical protein